MAPFVECTVEVTKEQQCAVACNGIFWAPSQIVPETVFQRFKCLLQSPVSSQCQPLVLALSLWWHPHNDVAPWSLVYHQGLFRCFALQKNVSKKTLHSLKHILFLALFHHIANEFERTVISTCKHPTAFCVCDYCVSKFVSIYDRVQNGLL